MPLLMRFKPANLTTDQYDGVMAKLNAGGHWPPDGLVVHVCYGEDGALLVSEVWESEAKAEAFGEHLRPVLEAEKIDVDIDATEVIDVHKIELVTAARV